MSESSQTLSDQIDVLCDEFEQACRQGDRPDLQQFLQRLPVEAHARLFQELLGLELEYRRQQGEKPQAEIYQECFPQFVSLIAAAFAEQREVALRDTVLRSASDTKLSDSAGQQHAPVPGKQFGGYELLSEIARGGMGVVYKARQVKLNRIVALKMIRSGELAGVEEVRRFHAEAEAAAALDHPHIVPIHEVGEVHGQHFFSMGFVEGTSLQERLKSGPLPPREAAELVRTIAEAVQYAHDKGIVHRDLKPANVLLDSDGKPRVTDFGLAKNIASDSGLTQTGQVMGTPSYMPPEQASGKTDQIGPLSDVYSLGAILYALLTGRPPFQAASVLETLKQVQEKVAVSPRELNPEVDRDLETITLKCLEKESARRYDSARSLAEDLKHSLDGRPILARPVGRWEQLHRWCRRNPAIASALGVILLLLLILGIGGPIVAWEQSLLKQATEKANDNLLTAIENERGAKKAETAAKEAALKARQEEEVQKNLASRRADEAKYQLYRSHLGQASALLAAGEYSAASWLLSEIPLAQRGWEARHLIRKAEGTSLTLRSPAISVAFSPDGRRIISRCSDKTLRIWDATTGAELLTLSGHLGPVSSVAFSPDGRRIVSGSDDATLKIWDATTGAAVHTLSGHLGPVFSVAFSSDGERIVSGSRDNSVKLWDATKGTELQSFNGTHDHVSCVAFCPDGRRIVSGSDDATLKIWDATTGAVLLTLRGHKVQVSSVTFSPDGRRIVSESDDNTIKFWDATTGAELVTLNRTPSVRSGMVLSPDGHRIVSSLYDNTLKVWNAATGAELLTLSGHLGPVSSVAFSPDGRRIVSGSEDFTLKVWDAATGAELLTLRGHRGPVSSVAFSPDGRRIISLSQDETLKVWDAASIGEQVTILGQDLNTIVSKAFSPDGRRIVSGSYDNTLKVWEAATGAQLLTLGGHEGPVSSVAFSPDGRRIVSGSWDTTVKVWDASTGAQLLTLRGHQDDVKSVAISPDGQRIVGGDHNYLLVWDATTGAQLYAIFGHEGFVFSVAFSPNGRRIVSASQTSVKLWDAAKGTELLTFHPTNGSVTCVAFSPDGRRIVSGSSDGNNSLEVWDAATGAVLMTLRAHRGRVGSVAFSPDGRRIVSGSMDRTLKIWDAATGAELLTLSGYRDRVENVAFSPDGRRIVSCSGKTLKVWDDAASGEELLILRGHQEEVTSVFFSPDGRRIVSGSHDKTLKIWDAATGAELLTLSGHEGSVSNVAFSPDGRWIGSVSPDGGPNARGAIIGGELQILSARDDRIIKVWNTETGELLMSEPYSEERFIALFFPPTTKVGMLRVEPLGSDVLLIRSDPSSMLWEEDQARRAYWAPHWSAEDTKAAEEGRHWFAACFHLRALLQHDDETLAKHKLPARALLQQRLERAEKEWEKVSQTVTPREPQGSEPDKPTE